MDDYKELIERLRNAGGGDLGIKMCHDAADAIEQLIKERDAAVADLKQHVYESGECFACRHYTWETDRCDRSDEATEPDEDTCWEWCGVQEACE